jgi:hypothetical protein
MSLFLTAALYIFRQAVGSANLTSLSRASGLLVAVPGIASGLVASIPKGMGFRLYRGPKVLGVAVALCSLALGMILAAYPDLKSYVSADTVEILTDTVLALGVLSAGVYSWIGFAPRFTTRALRVPIVHMVDVDLYRKLEKYGATVYLFILLVATYLIVTLASYFNPKK